MYELSSPVFWEKYQNLSSAELTQRAVKVKHIKAVLCSRNGCYK